MNRFCQHIVEAVKPEQLIDRDAKLLGEIDRRGSGKPVSAILIFLYLLMADTDHVAEFGLRQPARNTMVTQGGANVPVVVSRPVFA